MSYVNNMSCVNNMSYVSNMNYVNNMSCACRLYELCIFMNRLKSLVFCF